MYADVGCLQLPMVTHNDSVCKPVRMMAQRVQHRAVPAWCCASSVIVLRHARSLLLPSFSSSDFLLFSYFFVLWFPLHAVVLCLPHLDAVVTVTHLAVVTSSGCSQVHHQGSRQ